MQIKTFLPLVLCFVIFMGCKKNKPDALATQPPVVTTGPTLDNVLKDSVMLLTKDIYLWNTQIPSTFNPQVYGNPNDIMEAIRPYSIENGFAQPVDRFSFAVKQAEWDKMSEGLNLVNTVAGTNGNNGLSVFFRAERDLRVRLVEPNSPAGMAGVRRGWQIVEINGNQNITTGNAAFIIDNIYTAATVSITFKKPDGTQVTISLNQSPYQNKPAYLDTVYSVNNKKIGYFVFNSFLGNQTSVLADFQRVFSRFASGGVKDLVIDLRYNGGGYVSLQEKLANYIINTSSNGAVMMKQMYNSANSRRNETTLFKKAGSLNLSRVYFIVGRATASASELLINNLKPYMDVRLVGGNTNGKPVGFFPIAAGDWYIFPVSFKTVNSNGEGGYFNGLPVNSSVADGLDKDWGDLSETSLASVIRNITSGTYRLQTQPAYIEPSSVAQGNAMLESIQLKTTIGAATLQQ